MTACHPHPCGLLVQIGFDKLYLTIREAQRLLDLVSEALTADLDEVVVADITLSTADAYRLVEAITAVLVAPGRVNWQREGF